MELIQKMLLTASRLLEVDAFCLRREKAKEKQ